MKILNRIAKVYIVLVVVGLFVGLIAGTVHIVSSNAKANSTPVSMLAQAMPGTIPNGQPQFGNTQLILSVGTAALTSGPVNFASGTGTLGTSNPCYDFKVILATSGGTATTSESVLIGSTSSTCTYPIYSTPTSGTLSTGQSVTLDQVLNTNQLWVQLSTSNSGAFTGGGGTLNAIYIH
jgi:hypothetical protein